MKVSPLATAAMVLGGLVLATAYNAGFIPDDRQRPSAPAAAAAPGPTAFVRPISGGSFVRSIGPDHDGLDLAVAERTPVVAAAAGTVARVAPTAASGGYGNLVVLDHGGAVETRYAHLSGFAVSPGQTVTAGQTLGWSGNTGNSTGPHLHFEIRVNGAPIDPRTKGIG